MTEMIAGVRCTKQSVFIHMKSKSQGAATDYSVCSPLLFEGRVIK